MKLIIRIILVIIIFNLPIILFDRINGNFNAEYVHDWNTEDNVINQMNIEKLKNKDWYYEPVWLHEGEVLRKKDPNKKTILIVGDSCVWGHGYSNANHIWWQQFKHILKEKGYENVEVIAAGISGYNTNQQFRYIIKNENLMSKISPDIIVFDYIHNDPERRIENENKELIDKFISSGNLLVNHCGFFIDKIKFGLPNFYSNISDALIIKYSKNATFHEIFGYEYNDWTYRICTGDSIREYQYGTIQPMKKYIEENLDIPYIFISTPYYYEIGIEKIAKIFKNNDIKFYNLSEYVSSKANFSNWKEGGINPVNFHPSVANGKLEAKVLLQILKEGYSEVLTQSTGYYKPKFIVNDWMPYSLKPEKMTGNSYKFTYPASNAENAFLRLPIEKEYIKLNLEDPLNISTISIDGENIEEIELYINNINEKLGYDDQEMTKLEKNEDGFSWKVDSNVKITSINVAAKIKNGKEQDIIISIK